jgi:lipopolysaccharide transport system ATP-binding protein
VTDTSSDIAPTSGDTAATSGLAAGGEPAITVDNVSKRFRLYRDRRTNLKEVVTSRGRRSRHEDFWALRDVSLEIPRGSTYGLIGHNGSGKSTLLKLVAGIHRPSTGTITAHGRVSAMLELGAGFHPELSGRENIYLNGSILGMSRSRINASMDRIIEFSGLGDFVDTPVKVYSSGMYVRLGFSIAVNLDPEILVIDEIIAVGDEEFQRRCFDHLHMLRRRGVTIVFVTHSMPLVQSLCDAAAWLDHGEVRQIGPAAAVAGAYLREVNEAENEAAGFGGLDPASMPEAARQGSHEIIITGVEFLGSDGQPGHAVVAGEPMRVRVHYDARQPITDPVFGLGVYTDTDIYVTGTNSRDQAGPPGTLSGRGYVDHVYDNCPLNPGSYLVTAAVTDWSHAHRYDYWDHAFELHVRPGADGDYAGLVELRGAWSTPAGSTLSGAPTAG